MARNSVGQQGASVDALDIMTMGLYIKETKRPLCRTKTIGLMEASHLNHTRVKARVIFILLKKLRWRVEDIEKRI